MGKAKRWTMHKPALPFATHKRCLMPRKEFQELVRLCAQNSEPEVQEELALFASTGEKCVWGGFFRLDGDGGELCGCPIASICDWIPRYRLGDAQSTIPKRKEPFITAFDTAMRGTANGARSGIIIITDEEN